jgi:hypothetical protein
MAMNKVAPIAALAGISLGMALASGAAAQGAPPPGGLSTPQTRQDARETKEQERSGAGAGQPASQGQTLAPPQATAAPQPDLQNPKTFLPFVYGPLEQAGMTAAGSVGRRPTTHLLPATPNRPCGASVPATLS